MHAWGRVGGREGKEKRAGERERGGGGGGRRVNKLVSGLVKKE